MTRIIDRKKHQERVEDVLENIGVPITSEQTRSRLEEHIQVHKYFLDRSRQKDTDWSDAFSSWRLNVLEPLRSAVDMEPVRSSFPRKNTDELILEVSDHWHYLKEAEKEASAEKAAQNFARSYGNPFTRFLIGSVIKPALRKLHRSSDRARRIQRNMDRFRTEQDEKLLLWM